MNKLLLSFLLAISLMACQNTTNFDKSNANELKTDNTNYLQNRAPLVEKPYLELPLGSIKPQSWLLDQLVRMKTGMTGHLDEIYPEVMGKRNAP